MRIFKTRTLAKFTRQNGISDLSLVDAVERADEGWLMRTSVVASSSSGLRDRATAKGAAFAC